MKSFLRDVAEVRVVQFRWFATLYKNNKVDSDGKERKRFRWDVIFDALSG